jgi:acrylyl-CoA reductase (NADPH)
MIRLNISMVSRSFTLHDNHPSSLQITMTGTYRALLVAELPDGTFSRGIVNRSLTELPAGEVLVRVHYSSLNYKDGLSSAGNKGVTRSYPHVPGVDAAGVVEESASPEFVKGEEVLVTGYELGANHDGGFADYIRVPADWVVKLPARLSLRESMILGSGGFTAGLALHALLHHGISPDQGPVLVSGASGGVGCVGVALLAQSGFHVCAATRKSDEKAFLAGLGAQEVVSTESITDTSGKPLLSGKWVGGLDTVGGSILDSMLRQTKMFGAIACCGNVVGGELHTSVYPFILRGIALLGINSAFTPMKLRTEVWTKLATEWKLENLESIVTEVSLDELDPCIEKILRGGIKGRVVVNLQPDRRNA